VAASARKLTFCIAVALAVCCTQSALALDPRYPDWPCQQLKVPGISIANVWSGPAIDPTEIDKPVDAKEADLVSRLAARRTPIEEARKLIAAYLVGSDAEKQEKAKTLFAALYVTLNSQRNQVMNGIERFSRKQKAMAANIRAEAEKLRQMQDNAQENGQDNAPDNARTNAQENAPGSVRDNAQDKAGDAAQDKGSPDQTQREDLANQIAWETRIFEERRKSTSYVCDVPVLIEKRLFDLGRAIQDVLNAGSSAK
jgi:hypothetical protein